MNVIIRPYKTGDINDLLTLTLHAFEPIFISFEKILGPHIYPIIYPDWRKNQTEGVEKTQPRREDRPVGCRSGWKACWVYCL